MKLFRLSAEQEIAEAQGNLGVMYHDGLRVKQDHKEAAKWYRLAAGQGNAQAQGVLGLMYHFGDGVPKDYVLAHMWINLAASNGEEDAIEKRNLVEKEMTPEEIEKAKEMARNWKPKK